MAKEWQNLRAPKTPQKQPANQGVTMVTHFQFYLSPENNTGLIENISSM